MGHLLPDNTFGYDTHGNAICIDILNTCTHYFCVVITQDDIITLHNTRLKHLLNNYSHSGDTMWRRQIHRGTGVAIEDGAIWLGIGIQLIFADLDIPHWKPHYSTRGRKFLVSCLFDGKCLSTASLLVLSASPESIEHASIVGHQIYPRQDCWFSRYTVQHALPGLQLFSTLGLLYASFFRKLKYFMQDVDNNNNKENLTCYQKDNTDASCALMQGGKPPPLTS